MGSHSEIERRRPHAGSNERCSPNGAERLESRLAVAKEALYTARETDGDLDAWLALGKC